MIPGDARIPDRIWSRVTHDPTTGCWLWDSARPDGYAQVRLRGRTRYVHRITYEELIGPVSLGLDLDHLCRVRHCCNPEHLEQVTRSTNVRRGRGPAVAAERFSVRLTHCARGHEFTDDNVKLKRNTRLCLTCYRASYMRASGVRSAKRAAARASL